MVRNFWGRCGINGSGKGVFAFDALLNKLFLSFNFPLASDTWDVLCKPLSHQESFPS